MKLLHKLVFTFTVLAILPVLLMAGVLLWGQRQRLMAAGREHVGDLAEGAAARIDLLLKRTVEQVHQMALSRVLAEQAADANPQYADLTELALRELLAAKDRQWSRAGDPAAAALINERLGNAAAAQLRAFQQTAPERYAELMLTDRAGGLSAATNVTTDYYQADELWWQRA
ncbi:MAG: hypothetical protein ACYS1C_04410, partial [Planctomycetota bacterium]